MLKLNRFGVFPCLPFINMHKGRVHDVSVGSMWGRCRVDVVVDGKIYRINEEEGK